MWYFIIKGKPFTATVDLQLEIYWSQAVFIYSFLVHIAWSKTLPSSAQFSYEVQIIPFRFRECKSFTYCSIFSKHGCVEQEIIWTAMLHCSGLWAISNVGTKSKFVKVFTQAKIKRYTAFNDFLKWRNKHSDQICQPFSLMLIIPSTEKSKIITFFFCFATCQQICLKWYFIRNYLWLTY